MVSICKDMGNNTAYEQYMKILNKLQHHHNKDEDEQCNRLDKIEEDDDETVVSINK